MTSVKVKDKEVSISQMAVVFGRSVGNFFRKNNITKVIVVFDYNNDRVIFLKEEKDYGLAIQFQEGERANWNDFLQIRLLRFIKFPDNFTFARQGYRTIVKPLRNIGIIIENIPLAKQIVFTGNKAQIDLDRNIIIIGRYLPDNEIEINPELDNLFSRQVTQQNSPMTNNNVTPTPLQTKTQSTAAPSQPKPVVKHILNKELGSIDPLDVPPENPPTPEEIERTDKAYSKMILGE